MDSSSGDGSEGLAALNALPAGEAERALLTCCGSRRFASRLAARRPFRDVSDLVDASREVWWNQVDIEGWKEAFAAHPRIGDAADVERKASAWAEGEQAAARESSSLSVAQELVVWNRKYEDKFGHVFLICATGLAAPAILAQLKARYEGQPIYELQMAAKEQQKITELRLHKLLLHLQANATPTQLTGPSTTPSSSSSSSSSSSNGNGGPSRRVALIASHVAPNPLSSPLAPPFLSHSVAAGSSGLPASNQPKISTHVLDIVIGRPASGISVTLEQARAGTSPGTPTEWVQVGAGSTNSDGRAELLHPSSSVGGAHVPTTGGPRLYRLHYETVEYFTRMHGMPGFFPHVSVVFALPPLPAGGDSAAAPPEKVHVPLLLAPHAYSTYRGS